MNKIESPSADIAVNAHTEQPVSTPEVEGEHASTGFYVIGGAIKKVSMQALAFM